MQIFCDESGGADAVNEIFLVAAVALPPTEATRLIKSFRKAAKWKGGEVKGHGMSFDQRKIFFDLLMRQAALDSIVVSCSRCDPVGGWAMDALTEVDLYGHLLREACLALPRPDGGFLSITPDGGRYKKAELSAIGTTLQEAIVMRGAKRVTVGFQESHAIAGLQIADLIANSVFQAMGPSPSAGATSDLLQPLIDKGCLVTRPIELQNVRPAWLEDLQNAEKPPEGGFQEGVGGPSFFLSK